MCRGSPRVKRRWTSGLANNSLPSPANAAFAGGAAVDDDEQEESSMKKVAFVMAASLLVAITVAAAAKADPGGPGGANFQAHFYDCTGPAGTRPGEWTPGRS